MAAELADVLYLGQKAGVVYWDQARRTGVFEYTRAFAEEGKELAPLRMPLRRAPFQFPGIHESFSGPTRAALRQSLPHHSERETDRSRFA